MPKTTTNRQLIPMETISRRILLIRGQKVMLDAGLAALYEVSTGALNQAVRRNLDRFPADFMFQLNKAELRNWKSQIVISNPAAKMAIRKSPLAFTEQGVAMLSSVLHSRRAVQVNIAIMRAFVQLRLILATHRDLAEKLRTIEKKYDKQFKAVFEIIRHLMSPLTAPVTEPPKRPIGFSPLHKK